MAFTIIFGYIPFDGTSGFTFFAGVHPGVILVYYFLHGMALNSFACFLSCFFANEKASSFFMILLLIIFVPIGGILGGNMITGEQLATAGANAAGLIPYFNLNLGVGMFAAASSKPDPIFFSGVRERYVDFTWIGIGGSLPVAAMMVMLLVDTILYTVLFVYLDMVLPVGPGVKKHPLFFLKPSFWVGGKGAKEAVDSCAKPPAAGEAVEITEERKRVVAGQEGGLLCLGLAKQYPGAKEPAVVNVQFGVKESECFGLLGSNGAGKSTTIHILCGLHEPSSGTVLCGRDKLDIRHKLSVIQSAMGVCSQDNLLWDDLTGTEHLSFFCRIRQVRDRRKHIEYWLKRVNLFSGSDRRKRSKAYSGGMKRRLSVACSFIGNPRLVYLDEPSTGLDPESRRQLWHAVLAAKPSKCIILTTHALEEAEALCDRVGIMTLGLMRTLGTPTQLRLQFDQGYKFMLAVDALENEAAATSFATALMPGAAVRDSINGVVTFDVPKANVVMSRLFEEMEGNKERLHIKDWGLSHTTLEEVFLKIVSDTNSTAGQAQKSGPVPTKDDGVEMTNGHANGKLARNE